MVLKDRRVSQDDLRRGGRDKGMRSMYQGSQRMWSNSFLGNGGVRETGGVYMNYIDVCLFCKRCYMSKF